MVQDVMRTLRKLQDTAIGNCRKRIEEAARRTKRKPESDAGDTNGKPAGRGVTSRLREKYGL